MPGRPARSGFLTGPASASQYRADARDRDRTRPGGRGSDSVTPRARSAKRRRPPAERAPAVERPPDDAHAAAAAPLWDWLLPVASALVTLAVFWPVLGNQFLDWDDDVTLVNNPEFRGFGWVNLRWMLTATPMGHWIPTTWATFGADYLLWGMNPRGYHLTSLLLHAATAVAVYFVALRLLRAAMAG